MEDAHVRSSRMLEEYEAALEKTFQEHQEEARRHARLQIRQETEKLQREINKTLAVEQISIRRSLGQKQEELKEKLFVELNNMLANFLESKEYQQLLEHQIAQAVRFAGEDEVIIYLDPADEDKMRRLALHHSTASIQLSQYSFTGGTRAVIPSRHILIDNSFQTKLAEAQEQFHFDLTLTEGGKDNG